MLQELEIERPNFASYQKDFLYNNYRFTITEASTKVGKTFSHLFWIYERAHEDWNKIGYNHWWVAPVYSQAKIAFNRLKNRVVQSGLYKINQSDLTITCPNGAIIHFKSAQDPDNLYGEDVYSVVFDEAPRAKEDAWFALRSTITATKGKLKMIGNFGGNANWMHKLKKKSEEDKAYGYFKVTAWDAVEAGILEAQEIEQAQRDLPKRIFQQLYLAEQTESDDMLLTFDAINDLWTNPKPENNSGRYITADIAHLGSDLFVLMVWEGFCIIDYFESPKTDPKEVEGIIQKYADKHQVGRSKITYDADGLGGYLQGYLKGAVAFHNGGKVIRQGKATPNYKNLKTQCGYEFSKRVNDSQVSIQCEVPENEFKAELECLQSYALDAEGKIQLLPKKKVKEIIGRSPDRLDAFIMREVFELKGKKYRGVRT